MQHTTLTLIAALAAAPAFATDAVRRAVEASRPSETASGSSEPVHLRVPAADP